MDCEQVNASELANSLTIHSSLDVAGGIFIFFDN